MVAMLYRTIYIIIYCSKNITLCSPFKAFKKILVNFFGAVVIVVISRAINYNIYDFIDWFVLAFIMGIISLIIILVINLLFFKDDYYVLRKRLSSIIKR